MAGVGQHHGNHLPANPFPAAVGEPRDIAAFPVPSGHPLQLPPSRPAPQHSHANAPRDNPVRNRHFGVLLPINTHQFCIVSSFCRSMPPMIGGLTAIGRV